MTFQRKNLGKFGEDEAVQELQSFGYKVLERNYRNQIGEIDIIGKDGSTLCFIEVKTKSGIGFGSPEEMVNKRKQQKIIRIAQLYLLENKLKDIDWRIDVVAVDNSNDEIRIIKNAVEG
ncbi:YraN family protein [bacterium CG_4_10_14_0_2_um_filter_33_32]|nr:MAG: YraN family protein [bacterium CG2_30_33_46]PIR67691.1 MAG: YraN family protein [bacterium CG10_big_fil_rev_8_21_14_0_10_33_18]PIU76415.1 MAG: YraN family protein [bacterium CG06_land_8_20_14_3_00_33_50]PIY85802.1 MAG: YraN family protein [bacterium CG_4_10_14_0_8_um_filter_33_57]PIZ85280.1 MAG: YraN family protein [bacterium CG_4_10_14_0_2_um_filter_33_32]PJA72517.1 MAG: YraN family protein [bacterium CG_4_9_14_3_um_filter_33_26]